MAAHTLHAASPANLLHSQANKGLSCQGSAAKQMVLCMCTGEQLLGLLQAPGLSYTYRSPVPVLRALQRNRPHLESV